ncbi:unnamed protein product [Porites evermanni]|uniref:Uncharacterized protein n=1 Tax=Porites evermanni TaxID=104178 RepID=A0ABN8R3W1_9CNID|nr:unnamed protein product [Porites evermanni]
MSDQPIPEAVFEIQSTDVCERSWVDYLDGLSQALGRERHSADVCGNKPVLLDKCLLEDRGRIHLTSVKYMECNCSCMDCSDEGTVRCPWSKKGTSFRLFTNEKETGPELAFEKTAGIVGTSGILGY